MGHESDNLGLRWLMLTRTTRLLFQPCATIIYFNINLHYCQNFCMQLWKPFQTSWWPNWIRNYWKLLCKRGPILLHPLVFSALKLTFPTDVRKTILDGWIMSDIRSGSLGQSVRLFTLTDFHPVCLLGMNLNVYQDIQFEYEGLEGSK